MITGYAQEDIEDEDKLLGAWLFRVSCVVVEEIRDVRFRSKSSIKLFRGDGNSFASFATLGIKDTKKPQVGSLITSGRTGSK